MPHPRFGVRYGIYDTTLSAIEPRCFTCHNVRVLFDYEIIKMKYGKTAMNKNEKKKEVEKMVEMICKSSIKKPSPEIQVQV